MRLGVCQRKKNYRGGITSSHNPYPKWSIFINTLWTTRDAGASVVDEDALSSSVAADVAPPGSSSSMVASRARLREEEMACGEARARRRPGARRRTGARLEPAPPRAGAAAMSARAHGSSHATPAASAGELHHACAGRSSTMRVHAGAQACVCMQ
jgi:hypothetical protein